MKRADIKWRARKKAQWGRIVPVLTELEEDWPLTLRQAYYQLVAAHIIPNNLKAYRELSGLLVEARFKGVLPWEAIEDRGRPLMQPDLWGNAEAFGETLVAVLAQYRRDLLQGQPLALEVWIEKEALSSWIYEVTEKYGVPLVVAKGFSSVSVQYDCAERIRAEDRPTKILYFGDCDPSGYEMLPSMLATLREDFGLGEKVRAERIALTPEQVEEYGLPYNPDDQKKGDTRRAKFREMLKGQGHDPDLSVELDALKKPVLQALVERAITENLNMLRFQQEYGAQKRERDALRRIVGPVRELLVRSTRRTTH